MINQREPVIRAKTILELCLKLIDLVSQHPELAELKSLNDDLGKFVDDYVTEAKKLTGQYDN